MLLLKGRPGRPEGLHRGLPRVPKLSTVETFVHAPSSGRSLDKVVLAKGTPETLEGLVGSTADLAHALAASMTACWTGWRADPSALVVPFAQWRTIDPPAPQRFEGYGPDLKLLVGKGAEVRVGPALGRRMRAAFILEGPDGRNRWEREG